MLLYNNIAAAKTFDEGKLPAWEGGAECGLGWAVRPWDAADVQVTATPTGEGNMRVDVLFAEEVVPGVVAERMVGLLCGFLGALGRGGAAEGGVGELVGRVRRGCGEVGGRGVLPVRVRCGSPLLMGGKGGVETPEEYEIVECKEVVEGWERG